MDLFKIFSKKENQTFPYLDVSSALSTFSEAGGIRRFRRRDSVVKGRAGRRLVPTAAATSFSFDLLQLDQLLQALGEGGVHEFVNSSGTKGGRAPEICE